MRRPFWDAKATGTDLRSYDRTTSEVFESNIGYLVNLATADRARVLLLAEHTVTEGRADWRAMPNSRVKATLGHNELLGKIARERGALFLDLQQGLCACKEIMPDGRHLNEEGESQKSRLIFSYLT